MLDAVVVVFSKDVGALDAAVSSALATTRVRGRSLREWMSSGTPLRVLVDPRADDPGALQGIAAGEFTRLQVPFSPESVERTSFTGSQGVSGTLLTHWGAHAGAVSADPTGDHSFGIGRGGFELRVALAWLAVGVPILWGAAITFQGALKLFR